MKTSMDTPRGAPPSQSKGAPPSQSKAFVERAALFILSDLANFSAAVLKLPLRTYQVEPVHTTEDGESSDPSGFRVDGDGPLGAVEVIHPGQAWLKKGLAEPARSHSACLFAGLMLYKPPSDN